MNEYYNKTWKYLRGDLSKSDFESLAYEEDYKSILNEELYIEIVSNDFKNRDTTFKLKKKIKKHLQTNFPTKCHCIEISDLAVIDMGNESNELLETINRILDRGEPYWWLYLSKCESCNQYWLVGQEERHNDVFCLYRLNNFQSEDIINNKNWPVLFNDYTFLLSMGYKAGKSVRFVDPINSSLLNTIEDLAREQPQITLSEISKLLNLDADITLSLAKEVMKNTKVKIKLKK